MLPTIKQSILNPMSSMYQQNKKFLNVLDNCDSLEKLNQTINLNWVPGSENTGKELRRLFDRNSTTYKFYQFASSKYLIESSFNSTLIYLTLVSGGRTVNERPLECEIFHGADIDIAGAYGNVMKTLTFPLGIPRTISYNSNEIVKLKLKDFMKKFSDKIDGILYKIIVTGTLSFQQDLILSKIVSKQTLEKRHYKFNPEETNSFKMTADLVLLRKEIQNGVITQPIWEILTKVCTNSELAEINNLEIQAAIFG